MAVRAIWVVSLIPENFGQVLYSRKFATVERRAEIVQSDYYVSLPSNESFSSSILFALGLSEDAKQFVEWRDKASCAMQLPSITIRIGKKDLWPVLVIEQISCLLCCVPFIEDVKEKSLLNSSSVSVGFAVLIGILNFIGPSSTPRSKTDQKFQELDNYLTLSMPFGTPYDSDPSSVIAFYNRPLTSMSKKNYGGKQDTKKMKSSVFLEIKEFVRSAQQCDHQDAPQVVDVYGSITVAIDAISNVNDVSVTLDHSDASKSLHLKSLIVHPCVQTFMSTGGEGATGVPKKLWFVPLSHRFTLCFYSAICSIPPIQGIFKLKGDSSVELLIQLKLTENIQNSFHSCDVFIPFFNRGPITNYDFKLTQGTLQESDDKHSLKWNIGTKFSSKSSEIMLTAKVDFSDGPKPVHNDPFCVNTNCYVQVNFQQKNMTLSGCNIDSKSVIISPAHKAKIQIERTVHSSEYRIWNSFGELPCPLSCEDLLPKELAFE